MRRGQKSNYLSKRGFIKKVRIYAPPRQMTDRAKDIRGRRPNPLAGRVAVTLTLLVYVSELIFSGFPRSFCVFSKESGARVGSRS